MILKCVVGELSMLACNSLMAVGGFVITLRLNLKKYATFGQKKEKKKNHNSTENTLQFIC